MSKNLKRITTIGFTKAGSWKLLGGDINYNEIPKEILNTENILYAFVADGIVKYVGKTIQPLRSRINNYKNATRSTNIKVKNNILDCLTKKIDVHIYVLPDNGLLYHGEFHVNLAAGLEDSLISKLKPPWNSGKKGM